MSGAKFVGGYAEEAKKFMLACLLSRQHGIFVAPPGWGKTALYKSVLGDIFGEGWADIRLHNTMPVSGVMGSIDYAQTLAQGREVHNPEGTPFDPTKAAFAVDEVGRGNSAIYNGLLQALDQKNGHQPPMIATANFLPKGKEHEATLDRIALWCHIVPGRVAAREMAAAQVEKLFSPDGQLHFDDLPTKEEIFEVWDMVPGPKAAAAIIDVIEALEDEAYQNGRTVHPRRIEQWTSVLFYVSAYYTGTSDFPTVAPEATDALKYAWTNKTMSEAGEWAQIVGSITDPVQTVIDTVLTDVVAAMNQAADNHEGAADFLAAVAGEAGVIMGRAQSELGVLDDPRADAAVRQIQTWFSTICRGEKIERM